MHQLSYRAGDRWLVDGVELTASVGECIAIVGPNGAGKSTLFKMLSGEWLPSSGQINFNQKRLAEWPAEQLATLRAVLPQSSGLQFPFKVQEVVLMGRMPHATGSEVDRQIACEVMSLCDVLSLQHRAYTELSGGEKQRVQLARVLAQVWQPVQAGKRLLLLDEPTSSLDLSHQLTLMHAVQQICQSQVTSLVIVHDLNLAARFADRILMLHNGKPVALGRPQQVLTADLLECVFNVKTQVIEHPVYGCPLVVS
ncbi:heme ABC transporter ATP-binding protein [Ketobacter sp. MCCC 1A13808]|nr:heme ABC transporter ATP-binding protein [Ketobacter sp. MCCC 1A13808]RLP54366.1 MAG: heme ABC transporter ATP-binding protein [Ketobacter sp.]